MQIPKPYSQPTETQSLEVRPENLYSKQHPTHIMNQYPKCVNPHSALVRGQMSTKSYLMKIFFYLHPYSPISTGRRKI